MSGRDTFADNRAAGILSQMNHFCSGICLLIIICHSYRIKLSRRIIACQYAGRVLPRDSRTGFHLCPGQFAVHPFAVAAFRHKVVDSTFTFGITRIPVLNRTVFHFCTIMYHNLHDSRMQLIFITHRCGTSLQIRYIRIVVRHNQRTFKLSRITGIDTEIGRKLHRAAYSLRYVNERTVREHGRVQSSKEVIPIAYYRAHILLHKVRMFPYRFTKRAEYNAFLHQCLFESSLYRYRVHHCIHSHSAQCHLFFQRNPQFIECLYQFRIYFIHTLRSFFLLRRIGIVRNCLIINLRNTEMCPSRHFQRQPMAIRFQSELQQPFGFIFFR